MEDEDEEEEDECGKVFDIRLLMLRSRGTSMRDEARGEEQTEEEEVLLHV